MRSLHSVMQNSQTPKNCSISLFKMIFCKHKISNGLTLVENHFAALLTLIPLLSSSGDNVSLVIVLYTKIGVPFLLHEIFSFRGKNGTPVRSTSNRLDLHLLPAKTYSVGILDKMLSTAFIFHTNIICFWVHRKLMQFFHNECWTMEV